MAESMFLNQLHRWFRPNQGKIHFEMYQLMNPQFAFVIKLLINYILKIKSALVK